MAELPLRTGIILYMLTLARWLSPPFGPLGPHFENIRSVRLTQFFYK